jgi:hypothetical protein
MPKDRVPREKRHEPVNANNEKKVYRKPAFRREKVFETLALSCGKIGPTSAQCKFNRKTS